MRVIVADSVDEALRRGLELIRFSGIKESSRAGDVWVVPFPVTTVYKQPVRRVLLNPVRDANPYFHLMEALWLLDGRNDARWLDQFVGDFSARFAEPDGRLHGSYGYRWREHFDLDGGGHPHLPDQLDTVVKLLQANPQDRQAVISMWDPAADLGVAGLKDRPCNTHIYLRIRNDSADHWMVSGGPRPALDMTVCCRSNDIIWGAYGANAVHFSVLQEYLAARIGVGVGTYYQVSNNYHCYDATLDWGMLSVGNMAAGAVDPYGPCLVQPTTIVTVPTVFDRELQTFLDNPRETIRPSYSFQGDTHALASVPLPYQNSLFPNVAVPMFRANEAWKRKDRVGALKELAKMPSQSDWRGAAEAWCARRMAKVA